MDRFRVEVITKTPNPQQVIYAAMHQDYSEGFVYDDHDSWPSESKCGELIVKRLLAGERGHYGPIEHVGIVLNCGFFPHSVMQQIRTHRVGISFDVQCLAGNTEVTFVQSSGTLRKIKIAELSDLWANGEKAIGQQSIKGRNEEPPEEYRRNCKTRLPKMRLSVLNETTGVFETGDLKQVIVIGIQPVYRITLEDGKTLDCTTNHRLFTSEGWQRMVQAVGLVTDQEGQVLELTKSCAVISQDLRMNPKSVGAIRESPLQQQICQGFAASEISEKSHYSNHLLQAHPVKVTHVEFLGCQMTYDLEVEGPWHNFVANGMVVHNSNRYTGNRIVDAAKGIRDIEDVFYLRPVGYYTDRQGKRYEYTQQQRDRDLAWCNEAAKRYQVLIKEGTSEEHARGIIPFDVRQHWVVSFNARSLMHLLDLRAKPDAQLECQKLCDLIWPHFQEWVPAIAEWYEKYRLKKGRLSP
ncbi:FAD-dependent thymidylate synthase [Phormidium pseudopriestleyi FRX01]|uniref:FAD-dependent thymidylate synthase n=1 Tax=Phormidium pseudopriestleyi FRX01 TaxID=1759528 RepID=A0ABS3FSQ3_9CYAN|nr:FAD-dependent thymidylate synthase [Phormidium pseudopriestleyi]MBO0350136.1 FAD-dependent thymidylate synthase [Phormidium pseudopriestleyi FRX01]